MSMGSCFETSHAFFWTQVYVEFNVFWYPTSCILVKMCRQFGWTPSPHLQLSSSVPNMRKMQFAETSAHLYQIVGRCLTEGRYVLVTAWRTELPSRILWFSWMCASPGIENRAHNVASTAPPLFFSPEGRNRSRCRNVGKSRLKFTLE